MDTKQKNTFMCFLCGKFSETGPGLCSVNFHHCKALVLNEKKNGYIGWFQQGATHHSCIEQFLGKADREPETCVVCDKEIGRLGRIRCTKLAVYIYRKRGCAGVLNIHNKCFRKIKLKEFPFMKI